MAAWVLDEILKLLHPFIPFITEELWAVTANGERERLLALTPWPNHSELEKILGPSDPNMNVVLDVVGEARSIRTTYNIAPKEPLVVNLTDFNQVNTSVLESSANSIARLANTSVQIQGLPVVQISATSPSAGTAISSSSTGFGSSAFTIQSPIKDGMLTIALPGSFDPSLERARLDKEMQKADADIARSDAKLNNPKFMERAAEDVVEEEKEKREEAVGRKAKIAEALERLKGPA
jgi:valyl-tRNA synthetase